MSRHERDPALLLGDHSANSCPEEPFALQNAHRLHWKYISKSQAGYGEMCKSVFLSLTLN